MTKAQAKTIEIFLPDGDPKSIKVASITSRSIQVSYVPRLKLEDAKKRESLNGVGVYFLVGNTEEHNKLDVYIGEAENCISRLHQHNASKDFWQYALIITSRTNQFTKVHGKFLEWLCYSEGKLAERCNLKNGNIPNKPYVSEPMEADIYDGFETASVLISTLGLPIFQPVLGNKSNVSADNNSVFNINGRGGSATGMYTEEGFVIIKGSKFTKTLSPSMEKNRSHLKVRDQLIQDGALIEQADFYELNENALFPSPSNAGASVTGHPTNGWTAWKRSDGKTLSDIYRQTE